MSARRIRAILRKELREFRRNASIVSAMAIIPLFFVIEPLVVVIRLQASASAALAQLHPLLYMLGIPALVPALLAAYAVVGERQQGTLEPVLTTPVRREEFLLAKALAALAPSVVVAYAVYAVFLACIGLFADPAVARSLVRWPDVLAQLLLTPPLAAWSIWLSVTISSRASDIRVAQQLGMLACIPSVVVTSLIGVNVIRLTPGLAATLIAVLLVLDVLGWRLASSTFDRERLITNTR